MSKESSERIIKNKLIDYLKLKGIKLTKAGKLYTFSCPFCNQTANTLPHNKHEYNCMGGCNRYYDIIDLARKLDSLAGGDKDIYQHLKTILKLDITTEKEYEEILDYLKFYKKNNWDLLPLAKDTKVPVQGHKWRDAEHKSINEWQDWLDKNLGLAVKCGISSGITIIDIDAISKSEKEEIRSGNAIKERLEELRKIRQDNIDKVLKELGDIGNPLIQETVGGIHLIYKYEEHLPKTGITISDIHVDLENDGGYVIIYPTKLPNSKRFFRDVHDIPKMPKNVVNKLKSYTKTIKKTNSEEIREAIENENFKIDPIELVNNNLEGVCNNTFIKLGGLFRKKLNLENTGYVLNVLNKHLLKNPMPNKDIRAMMRELSKYTIYDDEQLAEEILKHLGEMEEASRTEIAMSVVGTNRGQDKKRVDKALAYLVKEEMIIKKGKSYILPKEPQWETKLIEDLGRPIEFEMPYLYDVANFRYGDLLLIGSQNKKGKSHIALNIIQQLVSQGITPYYISLEPGSRFKEIGLQLGLKEGDFKYNKDWVDPTQIVLRKNAVTIVDWLMVEDKSKTDLIFKRMIEQLYKTNGLLIVFMQLKSVKGQENQWFAQNMVNQFPALSTRYIYDNDDSGEYGYFMIDVIRDPKGHKKYDKIPCRYDWTSKILKRVDEIEKEKNQ